jgi:anti-anti-sigma factor
MVAPLEITLPEAPAVIVLSGEVDMASAPELSRMMEPALERGPLLIDMSEVSFLDSSGVNLFARAIAAGGCLILHGVRPNVVKILEITGLTHAQGLHVIPCEPPAGGTVA